jgi:hypothetical protein
MPDWKSQAVVPIASERTRTLTIVAQDPAVRDADGSILTASIDVPAEELAPGPRGYRVHVIDYDASTRTLYRPLHYPKRAAKSFSDPYAGVTTDRILKTPGFHAQNVYAITMRTLARFEQALGRRVRWSFYSHQLKVAPHAFADANAFYSARDEALLFGYFPASDGRAVFACLSHDVVAHETTHAVLDGLRDHFTDPSSPDQAAFHEAFADIVALLSVFSLREVVQTVLDRRLGAPSKGRSLRNLVREQDLTEPALRSSLLLGLAKEMGQEMSHQRGAALRQSATLAPSPSYLKSDEYQEPHRRGEILVAAVMGAFVSVWVERLGGLGRIQGRFLDRERVTEEASDAADYLLTMSIRALDYTPPIHLTFGDFLSALVTADREIRPDDSRYSFREHLRRSFAAYGIEPAAPGGQEAGLWRPAPEALSYQRTHFEAMAREPDEVFRFVWENRNRLGIFDGAYTRVESVRPCLRIAPDGFALRETVAECLQQLKLLGSELRRLGMRKPDGMPDDTEIVLRGGLTLLFDEYGRAKFSISNTLYDRSDPSVQERQSRRLQYLWDYGHFRKGASLTRRLSTLHRMRALGAPRRIREEW